MSVKVVELSGYTRPELKENKRKQWVEIGEDNDYFNYLIEQFNGSPTNNAVINGIAQQIYGAGLDANDKVSKVNQWAQMQTMLKPDALRKAILDLKIAGQCAFQVVYNRGKTKVQRIEHYPVETLRPELADEEGKIKAYYYTPDWKNLKPNDKPERLPSFGCGAKTDLNEILYVKPYSTGYFYFAPVDYQG